MTLSRVSYRGKGGEASPLPKKEGRREGRRERGGERERERERERDVEPERSNIIHWEC